MGQVTAHYERVSEETRLRTGWGALEFARSQEILLRYLPPAPAVVLDIGGAAGIYSAGLASLGYRAILLDLVYKHAAQARAAGLASAVQGDGRALPYPDACAGAVLLMGPLYHYLDEGQHRNPDGDPLCFTTAYLHLPEQLRDEMEEAGFKLEDLLPVEGPGWLAKDFDQVWADEARRKRLLDVTRRVEKEAALAGVSPHLMAVGRRR